MAGRSGELSKQQQLFTGHSAPKVKGKSSSSTSLYQASQVLARLRKCGEPGDQYLAGEIFRRIKKFTRVRLVKDKVSDGYLLLIENPLLGYRDINMDEGTISSFDVSEFS